MPDAFISYTRNPPTSSLVAQLIKAQLSAIGFDVWLDTGDIDTGGPFPEKLERAIEGSRVLICILCKETLESRWVHDEISLAHQLGKTLIPIFLEDFDPPNPPYPDYVHELIYSEGVEITEKQLSNMQSVIARLSTLLRPSHDFRSRSDELEYVDRVIEQLTHEQFAVFYRAWNGDTRRLAVKGCAGTGKTLVAAYVGIEQARARLKTLILCHNRGLIHFIKQIIADRRPDVGLPHIDVIDFTAWVNLIRKAPEPNDYNIYLEPTETELKEAKAVVSTDYSRKYDAIIVDEGQDFRNEWWEIVASALLDSKTSRLFIFYDEFQSIYSSRFEPTKVREMLDIKQEVYLSQHCRSGGKVFDVVDRFYPGSVTLSPKVDNLGSFEYPVVFADKDSGVSEVSQAVQDALKVYQPHQIVVLTTEPDGHESELEGMNVIRNQPSWNWKEIIFDYLGKEIDDLSDEPFPTESDIRIVIQAAKEVYQTRYRHDNVMHDWKHIKRKTRWRQKPETGKPFIHPRNFALHLLHYEDWAEGLPKPDVVKISTDFAVDTIRLYTVTSFKGQESDAVILYVPHPRDLLNTLVYVGSSRAKTFLRIVISKAAKARIGTIVD